MAKGMKRFIDGMEAEVATLRSQLQKAQEWREKAEELLKLCYENLDDDLEERPMRHSIGNIIGRIRALSALETGKEKA